jgi:N6-L-threonylcarbamoyladenine synthase
LAKYFQKPLIPVDHIKWHILALFLERNIYDFKFPMAVLTASWWHNNIYIIQWDNDKKDWKFNFKLEKIGQTLDDAAWECFDKVSRMLGWPYPWWVRISQQAAKWHPNKKFELHRIWLDSDKFEFSFSGTKAQINQIIRKQEEKLWHTENIFSEQEICDIAYEFQESVVEVLWKKLVRAAIKYNTPTIWLSWWVSANDRLKEYILELLDNKTRLKNQFKEIKWGYDWLDDFKPELYTPIKKVYCTDNAAMIGVAWNLN